MNEQTEKRYTLQEAADVLRTRECQTGHAWDVTEVRNNLRGVLRLSVSCSRCWWTAHVTLDGPDPSWPPHE